MPPTQLQSCARSFAHESRAGLRSARPYVWRGSGRVVSPISIASWQPSANFCRWRRRSLRAQHWAASSRQARIRRCGTRMAAPANILLGMEFITGDGVSSKSGGRVVKNVTGYDLHKLLIGSLGTLAVITRLNFRTFPLPPAQANIFGLVRHGACGAAPLRGDREVSTPAKIGGSARSRHSALFGPAVHTLPRDGWSAVITAAGHRVRCRSPCAGSGAIWPRETRQRICCAE